MRFTGKGLMNRPGPARALKRLKSWLMKAALGVVVLVLYLLYARHIAHRLSRLSIASEELPQTRPARSSARREPIVPVGHAPKGARHAEPKNDRDNKESLTRVLRRPRGGAVPTPRSPRDSGEKDIAAAEVEDGAWGAPEWELPESPAAPPLGESTSMCSVVQTLTKGMVLPDGDVRMMRQLNVSRRQFVFRYSKFIRYTHMATMERMRTADGSQSTLVSAWQGAPAMKSVKNAPTRMAVEGLPGQKLYHSWSTDLGSTWEPPLQVPTHNKGAVWSPVLHCDRKGVLWLFYSESVDCIRTSKPPTWEPGGDIYVMTMRSADNGRGKWSEPRLLLKQSTGGYPKVIANKLVVLSTGEWVLPFWSERPIAATCPDLPEMAENGTRTSLGVLVSTDHGEHWKPYGRLTDRRTMLLEPTVVELKPSSHHPRGSMMMLLRSDAGCVFKSISTDRGKTWTVAEPIDVPNPNTKFHAIRLEGPPSLGGGAIALVYNDHKRTQECRACRTHLHVALSRDEGASWVDVAILEDEVESGVRIHYPTLLQTGKNLLVIYSKFYLGLDLGLSSKDQGICFLDIDLTGLPSLPQLRLGRSANKTELSMHVMKSVVDHFLSSQSEPALKRFRDGKWHAITTALADKYDFSLALGPEAAYKLRRKRPLADYATARIKQLLPANDEQVDFLASMKLVGQPADERRVRGKRMETSYSVLTAADAGKEETCAALPCCRDFGEACLGMPECAGSLACVDTPCCALHLAPKAFQ